MEDLLQTKKDFRIENTDCLTLMAGIADNTVNLWNCDLPYGISRETGFKHGNNPSYDRLKVSMDFGEWDKREFPLAEAVAAAYRTLVKGGTAIFYDWIKVTVLFTAMAAAGFAQLRLIEWVKTNPVPLNQHKTYLSNAREFAVVGVKVGKPTFHGKYDNGIYRFPIARARRGEDRHPTLKPLDLMVALTEKHTNRGDLVGDFCMGSGTAGVAALGTGRRFVGSEPDPRWFEAAEGRLEKAQSRG
jgi:DNA modification methylase